MKAKWVTGLGIAMVALALIMPAMAAERGKKERPQRRPDQERHR
jgi:hypothetical protein